MPLHEYLCTSCGRTFEAIQSFGEAPLATCNRCGGALKRLISAPAVQFKGSGWYVNDYARSGSNAKTSEAGKPEGGAIEAVDSGGAPKDSPPKDSSTKDSSTEGSSKKDSPKKDPSKKGSSMKDASRKDS
jgi:putative FmdB family regulatory protein